MYCYEYWVVRTYSLVRWVKNIKAQKFRPEIEGSWSGFPFPGGCLNGRRASRGWRFDKCDAIEVCRPKLFGQLTVNVNSQLRNLLIVPDPGES